MFVCAGRGEEFDFATSIGVGMVEASINLSRIAIMTPPEFIIFVGSVGSYGRKRIFDIVHSKSSSNIEHSLLRDDSYTPIENLISTAENFKKDLIVNSSNYITTSKKISKEYINMGIDLENMEFFGVMSVAKEFNIPVGGVFVVTNYCFDDAHREFIENREKAISLLSSFIKSRFNL
jgi:nucleoside phosphorylase